ncbi:MAG TPA: DMSO reductase [Chromatiales bacterium]|nr:DMSO reductase [Chromatiales bacterium]
MHPAFSVIFLTTLIGVGQGLFLALYTGQIYALAKLLPAQSGEFQSLGSFIALGFLLAGLTASFFHLGHPERAWRSMSQWRTSWLSREVIVLPLFMVLVFLYGIVHGMGWTHPLFTLAEALPVDMTLIIGLLGTLAAFGLFLCTAMIYASLRFLQEWHTPLTVANYTFLGIASGFMLAAALSAWQGAHLVGFYGFWAVVATVLGMGTRIASLVRNGRLGHKSTLQTAIGVRHTQMAQKAQGFMGGSFNTREFFHGRSEGALKAIRAGFILLVFVVPTLLIGLAWAIQSSYLPAAAFGVQYIGLLLERYHFFADARHPQNLYYQSVA